MLALGMLREMQEGDLEPNVVTYNAVISACEKSDQRTRLAGVVNELPREVRIWKSGSSAKADF